MDEKMREIQNDIELIFKFNPRYIPQLEWNRLRILFEKLLSLLAEKEKEIKKLKEEKDGREG